MADEEKTEAPAEEVTPKRKSGIKGAILWSAIGLVFGAGGFALPLYCPQLFGATPEKESKAKEVPVDDPKAKMGYVEFGEAVVNLNSDRLNRYLKVNITLQIKEADREKITKLLETESARLRSWLLSYLSDAGMDDIRGAAGQNRLRREIQDQFNSMLFADGYDRIRDVLFQEFNVQ